MNWLLADLVAWEALVSMNCLKKGADEASESPGRDGENMAHFGRQRRKNIDKPALSA